MANITDIRKRNVQLMRFTMESTEHIFADLSVEDATTYRDGGDGWTALEVLCHLRDFEVIAQQRAQMMVDEEMPDLPIFYHEEMAVEEKYNEQDMAVVLADLKARRMAFRDWFKALSAEQWERGGNHPERDSFSMTDAVMQVGLHHANHIEQILRILREKRA